MFFLDSFYDIFWVPSSSELILSRMFDCSYFVCSLNVDMPQDLS